MVSDVKGAEEASSPEPPESKRKLVKPVVVEGIGSVDLAGPCNAFVSKEKILLASLSEQNAPPAFVEHAVEAIQTREARPAPFSSVLLSHYVTAEEMEAAQARVTDLLHEIQDRYPAERSDAHYARCLEVLDMDPKSFPQRVALMQAIIRAGSSFPSWKVFTVGSGSVGNDIWPFILDQNNWVPEMYQIMHHSVVMAEVRGKGLDESVTGEPRPTLEISKGGFGVGKTHFLRDEYGDMADGVVAPDRMKAEQQRLFPGLTSGQAHIQSAACATKAIENMNGSPYSRIVYDSSMSDPPYLGVFFQMAQTAGRGVVINDFVRTDMVRALGVLQREVGGPDPNIPAAHVLASSVYETSTRPRCIAMAANPESFLQAGTIPREIDYRLHLGDEQGGFPEHCVRIHYRRGEARVQIEYEYARPNLSEIEKDEIRRQIDGQLKQRHIILGEDAASQCTDVMMQEWAKEARVRLRGDFMRPVRDVLHGPQKDKMEAVFERRSLIEAGMGVECHSWEECAELIQDPAVRKCFQDSLRSLRDTNNGELNPSWTDQMHTLVARGGRVTYNDLPLALALELHSHLQSNPWP